MTPLIIDELPGAPRRPVLVMAFAGWNDAAEAATLAAQFLCQQWSAKRIAHIDPEEFFHFGLTRPQIRFTDETQTTREVIWPANEFFFCQEPGLTRDVIIGVGVEPHLKWQTFCGAVMELARQTQVALVVTLGALLAEVPHTKPMRLSGMATDPELAARLGIRTTKYEGPTGIVGVLSNACRQAGLPTASLWVSVPHYISTAPNPKAALALVRRVLELVNHPADLRELEQAASTFEGRINEAVAADKKIAAYIRKLEAADKEEDIQPAPPGDLPPAGELISEIETFLRQQGRPPDQPEN